MLLTLLVWPAAYLHEATTVHEVCAEHGELVDVSSWDRAAPQGRDGEPPQLFAAQEDHEGEHEHCPFVKLGQPSSPAPEVRDTGVRLFEAALVDSHASDSRQLSVAILLQAPKHSPPAIA